MNVRPKHTLVTAPIITYGDPFIPVSPTAPLEHTAGHENPIEQALLSETGSPLYELDLGQHTLFIMSDGSIDLLAHDEQTLYFADNGLRLNSDETYRLFISLQEQFQRKEV